MSDRAIKTGKLVAAIERLSARLDALLNNLREPEAPKVFVVPDCWRKDRTPDVRRVHMTKLDGEVIQTLSARSPPFTFKASKEALGRCYRVVVELDDGLKIGVAIDGKPWLAEGVAFRLRSLTVTTEGDAIDGFYECGADEA